MDTSGNGEGDLSQSDSDGVAAKPPPKRAKGKSKVWEKVAWFTRRSRSRDNQSEHAFIPDAETASLPHDHMDYDLSPTASTSDISPMNSQPWLESSSSSDGEPFDFHERYNNKRTRLYPNSEVVEQNCLKPSLARALFLQMEAASRGTRTPTKYAWQKKKKRSYAMTYGESCCSARPDSLLVGDGHVGRTVSVPHEITVSTQESCHCAACCSCPNGGRLFGACSFEQNLNSSTQSLDRALSHSLQCKKEPEQLITDPPSSINKSSKDDKNAKLRVQGEASQYKSNSLPTYYRNSVHRHNTPPNKWHLAICDRLLEDTASTPTVCECKTNATDDLAKQQRQRKPDVLNKVGPTEFRHKFESMKQWFQDFNDEQKNLVLKEILGDCGLPQIHLLSLEMEPRLHEGCPLNCQDLISWLPNSLALYIMSFLDAVSLCQSSIVCRAWYQLANEPCLWRILCCQAKWRLSTVGEQKQLIHHMLPDSNIDWKRVFSERFRLRNNWLRGRCNVRTFEGHTQGISCVQFDDTRIVSGSSDKTIKVWNIRTNTPWSVQTLVGHSGTVRCLHLEGNRLVSGSTDRTIKVWDLSTQQSWCSIACKVTMVGHLDTVRCLQVDDEKVISGSYDKTLKVWDIRSGECRRTLRGHGAAVLCVQFDKDKLMSGSADKTIKVWNFDGLCIMTLHGHHDAVTCLQFDTTRIISGSLDCTLKFWNITSGDCMNTIDWKASEGHTGVVRCLQADSWRVVSASDDRTLKVWSIETGQRLVTLRNHTDGVTCLQFNDSIIVSGSYDKTVKLWDFSVC